MKLGEGGEAFFVFETTEDVPESLQTSPVISPASSPEDLAVQESAITPTLQEPEFLDLNSYTGRSFVTEKTATARRPFRGHAARAKSDLGSMTPLSLSPSDGASQPNARDLLPPQSLPSMQRSASEVFLLNPTSRDPAKSGEDGTSSGSGSMAASPKNLEMEPLTSPARSTSPPLLSTHEAVIRARALAKKLSSSNIPSHITGDGDLMLDMTGYKSREEDSLRAEIIARKILAEELEGNYDIGALIAADEQGNLWIYSSEDAKESALRKADLHGLPGLPLIDDAASDPGVCDPPDVEMLHTRQSSLHEKDKSGEPAMGLITPPESPPLTELQTNTDTSKYYAKTLRLTSDQLKALQLTSGANDISFSVNRATCQAHMYYWKHDTPIVISDIDGTITKSDALGHVLNMIGRDWTHPGVAKLYTDITANGYHVLYLTSRSVGQADSTRAYLNGVSQEGFKLPKGPVIMSPDRTMAALRREIYLRKPEVFKMACLRDIRTLFSETRNPFYAGFGNRLTDALSYRSVNIPSSRIFTINFDAEVSLDLLSLNKYKSSYVTMREVVDHFFPPVGLLIAGGGEDFTDFNYWRDPIPDFEGFQDTDSELSGRQSFTYESLKSEDEGSDDLDEDHTDLSGMYVTQGRDLIVEELSLGKEVHALTKNDYMLGTEAQALKIQPAVFAGPDSDTGERSKIIRESG